MNKNRLPELPYERIAMAGGEMPDGLCATDQQMFLQLRLLYESHRRGIVDRETAQREKTKMMIEYNANLMFEGLCRQWANQVAATERARQEYRKNRTLENADAIILAFEGVPVEFDKEAL